LTDHLRPPRATVSPSPLVHGFQRTTSRLPAFPALAQTPPALLRSKPCLSRR
jgi:hypothetical protein